MFSFASSYQLDIFSGLEIGSCVNLLSNCLDSIKLGPVQALGMFPLPHLFPGNLHPPTHPTPYVPSLFL